MTTTRRLLNHIRAECHKIWARRLTRPLSWPTGPGWIDHMLQLPILVTAKSSSIICRKNIDGESENWLNGFISAINVGVINTTTSQVMLNKLHKENTPNDMAGYIKLLQKALSVYEKESINFLAVIKLFCWKPSCTRWLPCITAQKTSDRMVLYKLRMIAHRHLT